jgi:hypothetical protein
MHVMFIPHRSPGGRLARVRRRIRLTAIAAAVGARTQTITIQGSTDGTTYTTLVPSAGYTFNPATGNTVTGTFNPASIRYLKLTFTANAGWPAGQLSELQAYAS